MPLPYAKPLPREKQPRKGLRSKSRMKSKSDPIPAKIKKEVYERDQGLCRGCCQMGTQYHHITFRSQYSKDMPFKLHSKENLVLLCLKCHDKAHNHREWREFWEKWRDLLYRGE